MLRNSRAIYHCDAKRTENIYLFSVDPIEMLLCWCQRRFNGTSFALLYFIRPTITEPLFTNNKHSHKRNACWFNRNPLWTTAESVFALNVVRYLFLSGLSLLRNRCFWQKHNSLHCRLAVSHRNGKWMLSSIFTFLKCYVNSTSIWKKILFRFEVQIEKNNKPLTQNENGAR